MDRSTQFPCSLSWSSIADSLRRESPVSLIEESDADGLESILAFRREFPRSRVIAMTGGSDMIGVLDFLEVAAMLGACGTLQKPFKKQALLNAVAAVVDV